MASANDKALEIISLALVDGTMGDDGVLLVKGTPGRSQNQEDGAGVEIRVDPEQTDDALSFIVTFFQHSGFGKNLEQQVPRVLTISKSGDEVSRAIVDSDLQIVRVQLIMAGQDPINIFSVYGPNDRAQKIVPN
jgi:hypothetical protein